MSDVIHISVDISRAKRGMNNLHPAVVRAVEPKLLRGAEEVARTARINAPKAFSNLTNSIRSSQLAPLHFQVSENVKHGRAVEEGSRPHGVDSRKLIPWVETVLGLHDKDARSVAFLIARSIALRGTRWQKYMQPAAETEMWRVRELVLAGVEHGSREAFA